MKTLILRPSLSRLAFPKNIERKALPLPSALRSVAGLCLVAFILCGPTFAQGHSQTTGSQPASDASEIERPATAVEIDGRPILMIREELGGFTPQERAENIARRIIALARRRDIPVEAIHAKDRGVWSEILAGDERIMGITEADARAAGRRRADLAAEYTEIMRQIVKQYRLDHTWQHFILGVLYTVVATAALLGLLILLFLVRHRWRPRVDKWLTGSESDRSLRSLTGRFWRYFGRPLLTFSRFAFWLFVLLTFQAYVTVTLRFFPATRHNSYQITNWVVLKLSTFGAMVIGYVPNLVLVLLIGLITFYFIKVNEYVFGEIRDERLSIRGFYPDWAEPTAKLVRVLILAAAAIVMFPYLPGSNSPAFKGISVFLGVLLSLGSTSAVAHAVAGTILTYMRSFQVGDFVRIGNDVGEVIEKTLLVTRICTQKKEVITIPNGTVLGGVVVNYSAEARHQGVIFHTTVTIGYTAPWRKVHELLIAAALATDDVLHDPAPFVLQTALNDFYVAYELNAYTARPSNMLYAYSVLHQNIQDKFNEAGVEINSPHYTSLRDGNRVTIPEQYLPGDYKSPLFECRQVNESPAVHKQEKAA